MKRSARVLVIAEAGVNHDGSLAVARQLVDAAADAGADVVKFQTFRADALVQREAPKAAYQRAAPGGSEESQHEMLRRLELPPSAHEELVERARRRGLRFLSTPFDVDSLAFLVDGLGLETLKLGSGDLTHGPLLLAAGESGREVILSTGMGTLGEIEAALQVLAFGYTRKGQTPGARAFAAAFASEAGQTALRQRVTLLHCTSEYPAPVHEVNLRCLGTLRRAFGLRVGLSDHTQGIAVATAGAALGASVIEKHFTLDRARTGPDHAASLEPEELAQMVRAIRDVERALGRREKRPTESEKANLPIVRRSLVASRAVVRGEPFTRENLAVKRPAGGISPLCYWDVLGSAAARDYRPDEPIDPPGSS
jgi:N-acetylneuraminate synthase